MKASSSLKGPWTLRLARHCTIAEETVRPVSGGNGKVANDLLKT